MKPREKMIFPKLDMTGDMKVMRDEIIATKTLLGNTIAKEVTETSTRLEFCSFMRRKKDNTSTTKSSKR